MSGDIMSEKKIPRPNQKATYLTFLVGHEKTKIRVKVKDKGIIIGRSTKTKEADVDLKPHNGDRLGVSRQHLLIGPKADYFYVQDLESINSTWLNKVRMRPMEAQELYHGDTLHLGECRLEVYYTYEDEVQQGLGETKVIGEASATTSNDVKQVNKSTRVFGAESATNDDVQESEKSTRVFGTEKPQETGNGKTGLLPEMPKKPKDADPS